MSKHWRILGISLLALTGVLAVNASAAQADWKLLKNATAVNLLKLVGSIGLGLMLVKEIGGGGLLRFSIHCTGGTFTVHLHTVDAKNELAIPGVKLLGSGTAQFTGCTFEDSKGNKNANCTVKSPGAAAGTINAEGKEGEGKMEGAKTYAELKSPEFTVIEIIGALCPVGGEIAEVSGAVTVTVDKAETSEKVHTGALDEVKEKLLFGENEAVLMPTATEEGAIKGTAEEETKATWAIDLCGLTGFPAC